MVKPGINTSEFLLIVLTIIGNIVAAVTNSLNSAPAQHVSWGSLGLVALYALSRSLVKYGAAKNSGGN